MNDMTGAQKRARTAHEIHRSRRGNVSAFIALDVMSAATRLEREGANIIHMEVGEPGAACPTAAREAAIAALAGGRVGYTEALGRMSLRHRIARHYRDTYNEIVPPERIVVTTGSSAGFLLSFLALFDAGARVAIAAPGYPAYFNILDALDIETVTIETRPETRHIVTGAMIEAAHKEKKLDGVLLMSPANPSGTMMKPRDLADVCEVCDRLGIAFISDEIYHGLTYDEPATTALTFSSSAIVVNSFSKYFCMTGWRIGWLVLPEAMVRSVERLQQSFAISVPMLSQVAAEAVFDSGEELEKIRLGYARNREILLNALPALGLGDFHPLDGAFYIYADIGKLTNDSSDFCKRMLVEAGVATTPGLDFDRARGNHTMRMSFAGSESDILTAVSRLKGWLK